MSLPDPFQKLVDNLRQVLLTTTTAPVSPVTNITNTTSSPSVVASPMAKLAPFTGVAEECNGFILQCSLSLEMQLYLYTTDRAKIAFIISLLTGRALQWASGWTECSLLTTYRQGLEPRVHLQLSAYDDFYGLERFIQLSIRCANRMQSCSIDSQNSPSSSLLRHPGTLSTPDPRHKPLQIDLNCLSSAERQTHGLCLYCDDGGHVISMYPIRPPRPMVSVIKPVVANMQALTTIVILTASKVCVPAHALLDSGSARNFISSSLCRQLNLPTTATKTTYQVQSITGKPLC